MTQKQHRATPFASDYGFSARFKQGRKHAQGDALRSQQNACY